MPTATHSAASASEPVLEASQPVIEWWMQHWMDAATPMARMQLAWMETVSDAMHHEAEFLMACASSSERMAKCFMEQESLKNPAMLGECYNDMVKEVANAHLSRMGKVAELSSEFRQKLWEEI
ncbi:hypothetical protein L861_03040 [Litchfieldella anticariensis FP35 = DSM 16096]|uniref:Phasin domain-containing protein n=1 Tax=Litchfieldella anticariensis (strain DSM 16096 / CECT 5854 / CIP 108499 / LMG 22089 / FP35) TaxID=1121939 RepID=S2KQY6_LITA3|nr:hypothetical protein [Halomonas anticariensis]EPC04310.1 hypothetical protein L861_03040 [Halomonas anticariensis FP35 = DSM 16096]